MLQVSPDPRPGRPVGDKPIRIRTAPEVNAQVASVLTVSGHVVHPLPAVEVTVEDRIRGVEEVLSLAVFVPSHGPEEDCRSIFYTLVLGT